MTPDSVNQPAQRRAGLLTRYLQGLRFPVVFGLAALLFLVDLFIPDVIPFADEIMLAIVTALFGSWKRRRPPADAE
jgi:Family of unknown function (DUF6116)